MSSDLTRQEVAGETATRVALRTCVRTSPPSRLAAPPPAACSSPRSESHAGSSKRPSISRRSIISRRAAGRSVKGGLIVLPVARRGVDRYDIKLERGPALGVKRVKPLGQYIAGRSAEDQNEGIAKVSAV